MLKTVRIPLRKDHAGHSRIDATVNWICPTCGNARGEVSKTFSYDGSRRMVVDGWENPCGHLDQYADVVREAQRLAGADPGT